MVKKTKGKHRLDKFYHLAREQGYRSRAAFKLIQLNRKYDFLSRARTLLDLCAAPGGWSQVAVKNMPVGSLVIAVDLVPVKPVRGVRTLLGDITTQQCRTAVRKEAGGALIDVVLHDGAPNVGGAWSSEAYSQSWLVLEALKLATDLLAPRGTFVTKVFRSKDYSALVYALKQLFTQVEATKPAASRNASAEIFIVCQGYKAPSKIDPRLLDAKHLFQEVAEAPRLGGPDALMKDKVKQRRHREGYEEGVSLVRRPAPAAAFVASASPVEMLGRCTSLALAGAEAEVPSEGIPDMPAAAALVRSHPATSDEVSLLCGDLQVLGRSEFKQLLKWRLAVRRDLLKALAEQAGVEGDATAQGDVAVGEGSGSGAAGSDDDEGDDGDAAAPEARMLQEMSDIKDRMEQRRKRERRRRRELKLKSRVRAAQLAQGEGLGEEQAGGPESLFSLGSLRAARAAVDDIAEAAAPGSDPDASSDDAGAAHGAGSGGSEVDSEEEQRRYDAVMEDYLEESYRAFQERQRQRDVGGVVKKKRRRLGMDGEMEGEEGEERDASTPSDSGAEDAAAQRQAAAAAPPGGGLIVSLDERRAGVPATAAAAASQWFSQDLFDDADVQDDADGDDGEAYEQPPAKRRHVAEPGAAGVGSAAATAAPALDSDSDGDMRGKPGPNGTRGGGSRAAGGAARGGGGAFEEVPLAGSGSSSESEDEFEGLAEDAKAEVLALAKKFLRRKSKESIMEAAYNRYAFHDTGLPKWFADDERKYMRPAPLITGAEYKEAKEQLRAIDARPIKKVAEAKARKRKRLAGKLAQARQKAESIANQEDVPMKAKMREIEKVYSKARGAGKGKRGAGGKDGKGGKGRPARGDEYRAKGRPLDARLRSDKRGMDRAAAHGKGRGGKFGGKGKGRR